MDNFLDGALVEFLSSVAGEKRHRTAIVGEHG